MAEGWYRAHGKGMMADSASGQYGMVYCGLQWLCSDVALA